MVDTMSSSGGPTVVGNGQDGDSTHDGWFDIRTIPGIRVVKPGRVWRLSSWYNGLLMVIGSIVALVASFMLSLDSLKLAVSDAPLACDVNTKLSCSKVSASWQSTLLTIDGTPTPNAFFGLAAFGVFIGFTFVLMLGWRPPRFARWLFALGIIACDVFAVWLFMESVFSIKVLCPWCLTMDVGCFILTVGALRWWSMIGWHRLDDYALGEYRTMSEAYAGTHSGTDPMRIEDTLRSIDMTEVPVYAYHDAGKPTGARQRFHEAWLGFTSSWVSMLITVLLFLIIAVPVLVHAFS